MAPAKGSKPEINPWGWTTSVQAEDVGSEHILKAYRIIGYHYCEERRRNCKKNPFCYWGLGEKKWVQGDQDGSEEEDNGFREEGEFAGLQNLGATCYVNSLLQLWYHNPILRPAIFRWHPPGYDPLVELSSYCPDGPIAELQAMFARMKMSKMSKIDPTNFVKSLQLDTGEQQDAQEFSKLFMEVILKMLTAEYGAVRNAVSGAFRGELQNETECSRCKNKTQRQESFSELELGVRKNLNESLDELLKDELLTETEQYYCSVCQMKNDATRRTQLLKLPPVLNLQLMRFVFDRETYRKKKVTTRIQFPEVLDMSSRVTSSNFENGFDNSDDDDNKQALIYHLNAVLIHNGSSASSGHYVAQIKDLRTGNWLTFNDENVDPMAKKTKSQKLVLKEDDGSGSDTEKSKQKKGETEGYHSSTGPYMLVYTLEKFIKQPEADPEPWPYLEQLIKAEDEAYEDEIKKCKNEKDYDNILKEQRKKEIASLYPSLQLNKKIEKQSDSDIDLQSDDDDFQPPKKKLARSEMNGTSKTLESKPIRNGNHPSSSRKELKEGRVSPNSSDSSNSASNKTSSTTIQKPSFLKQFNDKSQSSIAKMHFISFEWLQNWLDPVNPPPPIENKLICCEHGKLAPPLQGASGPTSSCPYKVIPQEFALVLYDHYSVDGTKFHGLDAFCVQCVKRECQRLRCLAEIDNDHKIFVDSNKSMESSLTNSKDKNKIGNNGLQSCFWLSKEVIKSWKKNAKSIIEKKFKSNYTNHHDTSVDGDAETVEEDTDVSSTSVNSELICNHGNLIPEAARKLIPEVSWNIVQKYFNDAVPLPVDDKHDCEECLNAQKGDSELRSQYKVQAQKQKQMFIDLFKDVHRPNISNSKNLFVVSHDFVKRWKQFIREPGKTEPVIDINNKTLLCPHEKFLYPLKYHDEIIELRPDEIKYCLVSALEWQQMYGVFSIDIAIEIKVTKPNELMYEPEECGECSKDWWSTRLEQKFSYTNQSIHIIRRDKDEGNPPGEQKSEDEEDYVPLDPNFHLSQKRIRTTHDPSSWQTPKWRSNGSNNKDASDSKLGTRVSSRRRRQPGEKCYKILRTFNALPSDQHLFFEGSELQDYMSSTLGELKIPADATLYLEIDTVTKQEDPTPVSFENGFIGSILVGNNNNPSTSSLPNSPDPPVDSNDVDVEMSIE